MSRKREVRKGIDSDGCGISHPNICHLGLLEIGDDPNVRQRYHGDDLGADIDELTGANLTLADRPVYRGHDLRVVQIIARKIHLCLRGTHLCFQLLFLDIEAGEQGLLLVELRAVELQLSLGPLLVVFGLFEQLLSSGKSGHQVALALRFQ